MTPFPTFRRKLEDAVTVAINTGVRVSADEIDADYCRCPLGTRGHDPWPYAPTASKEWGITEYAAKAFMRGFEGFAGPPYEGSAVDFYNLGKLYRARFP